jgi:hypothetical protein
MAELLQYKDKKKILSGLVATKKDLPQRHEDTKNYNIILLIPFLIRGTLKLIRKPSRFLVNFK